MKKINRYLFNAGISVLFLTGIVWPGTAFGATTPSLGVAADYGVLGSTYTNTSVTTVNGEVGFATGPAVDPLGTHVNYGSVPPYSVAGADQGTALSDLNSQACTFTFIAGAVDLSSDVTHGAPGIYAPGVYCSIGAMNIGGPISLSGLGTYIFRATGALTTSVGAGILLNGASACDVFWTSSQAATFGANTSFFGTLISDAGITVGANTTWVGRALSFGGTITTDTDTITVPTCPVSLPVVVPAAPPVQQGSSGGAVYTVSVMNQPTMSVSTYAQPQPIQPAQTGQPAQATQVAQAPSVSSAPASGNIILSFPDTGLPPGHTSVWLILAALAFCCVLVFGFFKKCVSL
jgi:hypothetical protein